jgi:hypothetical protein
MRTSSARSSITVSFRPAIPRRVAPQQSPLPLRRHKKHTSFFHSGISLVYMLVNLFPIFVSHTWGAVYPAGKERALLEMTSPGIFLRHFVLRPLPKFRTVHQNVLATCPWQPHLSMRRCNSSGQMPVRVAIAWQPGLTSCRGADKNRALLRQAVNFVASERPSLNPASKDMFF